MKICIEETGAAARVGVQRSVGGFLVYGLLVCGMALQQADAAQHHVTLVEDGKANASIVIAADPTPAANLAAIEMQFFVEKMTGATLPIINDEQDVTGNRVLIGDSKLTKALGLDVSEYHQMEKLIKFYPDALVLLGRDDKAEDCRPFPADDKVFLVFEKAMNIDYNKTIGLNGPKRMLYIPGMYDYQGSLRATYRFLEKWCGVRFFGPMPINLHIPKHKSLTVSGTTDHHRSGINSKYGSMGMHGRRSKVSMYGLKPTASQLALGRLRARWGGEPWFVNHTFGRFNYKRRFIKPTKPEGNDKKKLATYEQHKADFEREIPGLVGIRKDGKPANQFCYKNEAFIKQIVKDARDFFDGTLSDNTSPMVQNLQGRSNVFPLVPNDVGGYCECEKCEPLHKHGLERGLAFNGGWASDYVFDLVNAVAREVAKTHPDKYIGALAYEGYYWPPKSFKMEKNVQMVPCMHTKNWGNSPNLFDNEIKYYREWVNLAKEKTMGPMGMWNYDFDSGVMTAYYPVARGKIVKQYLRDGVKHVYHCGAPPMVEMYVTCRLYEDPELDTQELVTEFFAKYYGPAAKAMQDLYAKLEAYSSDPRYRYLAVQKSYVHDSISLFDVILTPERMGLLRMDINNAKELAKEEPYATRLASAEDALVTRYEKHAFRYFREKNSRQQKNQERYGSQAKDYIASVTAYPGFHYLANRPPDQIVSGINMLEQNPNMVVDQTNRTEPNTAQGDAFEFPKRKARYVRIEKIANLCEIRIFTDQGEEVGKGKPVKASGSARPDKGMKFINDGIADRTSAWWAKPPNWAEIDLGKVYDISKIWLQPWWDDKPNGRISKHYVLVSENGNDWNQVGTKGAKLDPGKGGLLWGRQESAGAWVMFDLGGVHELDEMHIWNYDDSKGNSKLGMKNVEIAYAANAEELFKQNWIKMPINQLKQAPKEPQQGADNIIDFGRKDVRYVYIHTLGGSYSDANGVGNWNSEGRTEKEKFQVGLGQVRFYGKSLQMPKPFMAFTDQAIKLTVPGIENAEIHYTIDNALPTRRSPLYQGPVEIGADVTIRSKAFGKGKRPSGSTMNRVIYRDLLEPLSVAKGAAVTSSGSANPQRDVKFINDGVDGRKSAWWSTGNPRWAQLDLGNEYEIDKIWMQPWWDDGSNGRVNTYNVAVSSDGENWQRVADLSQSKTPSTEDGHMHHFKPVTARHVKIENINHLCEIKIYRTATK